MPDWLHWLMLFVVLVLVAACVYLFQRIQHIQAYLGTNAGPPAGWTGLSGWARQMVRDMRDTLENIACKVYMLEVDYPPTTPKPSPRCPPGPPGTVPKDDPNYPP
jgi:hypothetical protein